MSKKYQTYGVIIMTKKGKKVMGVYGNSYPTKSDIRMCLEEERRQELNRILNGNSGWRKPENIDKEVKEVDFEFINAVSAVNNNKYKVKVLR